MLETPFPVMAKLTTPICNLDCKYCFYLEKEHLYPKPNKWAMSADVLERYMLEYITAHPMLNALPDLSANTVTLLGISHAGYLTSKAVDHTPVAAGQN